MLAGLEAGAVVYVLLIIDMLGWLWLSVGWVAFVGVVMLL
jgi:hypothetical protein